MSGSRYLEELYDTTFASVHEMLREQARRNPERVAHQIRQVLKTLYVQQGNDWAGRGVVGDTSIDASIAAHESILADLVSRPKQRRSRHEKHA